MELEIEKMLSKMIARSEKFIDEIWSCFIMELEIEKCKKHRSQTPYRWANGSKWNPPGIRTRNLLISSLIQVVIIVYIMCSIDILSFLMLHCTQARKILNLHIIHEILTSLFIVLLELHDALDFVASPSGSFDPKDLVVLDGSKAISFQVAQRKSINRPNNLKYHRQFTVKSIR